MKCLDCGMEMEQGTVQGIGQGGGHWYEFTSDEEKNWLEGIKEGFEDYIKDAGNTFGQVKHLFSNALYGMEDFLVDFIKTGKALYFFNLFSKPLFL